MTEGEEVREENVKEESQESGAEQEIRGKGKSSVKTVLKLLAVKLKLFLSPFKDVYLGLMILTAVLAGVSWILKTFNRGEYPYVYLAALIVGVSGAAVFIWEAIKLAARRIFSLVFMFFPSAVQVVYMALFFPEEITLYNIGLLLGLFFSAILIAALIQQGVYSVLILAGVLLFTVLFVLLLAADAEEVIKIFGSVVVFVFFFRYIIYGLLGVEGGERILALDLSSPGVYLLPLGLLLFGVAVYFLTFILVIPSYVVGINLAGTFSKYIENFADVLMGPTSPAAIGFGVQRTVKDILKAVRGAQKTIEVIADKDAVIIKAGEKAILANKPVGEYIKNKLQKQNATVTELTEEAVEMKIKNVDNIKIIRDQNGRVIVKEEKGGILGVFNSLGEALQSVGKAIGSAAPVAKGFSSGRPLELKVGNVDEDGLKESIKNTIERLEGYDFVSDDFTVWIRELKNEKGGLEIEHLGEKIKIDGIKFEDIQKISKNLDEISKDMKKVMPGFRFVRPTDRFSPKAYARDLERLGKAIEKQEEFIKKRIRQLETLKNSKKITKEELNNIEEELKKLKERSKKLKELRSNVETAKEFLESNSQKISTEQWKHLSHVIERSMEKERQIKGKENFGALALDLVGNREIRFDRPVVLQKDNGETFVVFGKGGKSVFKKDELNMTYEEFRDSIKNLESLKQQEWSFDAKGTELSERYPLLFDEKFKEIPRRSHAEKMEIKEILDKGKLESLRNELYKSLENLKDPNIKELFKDFVDIKIKQLYEMKAHLLNELLREKLQSQNTVNLISELQKIKSETNQEMKKLKEAVNKLDVAGALKEIREIRMQNIARKSQQQLPFKEMEKNLEKVTEEIEKDLKEVASERKGEESPKIEPRERGKMKKGKEEK